MILARSPHVRHFDDANLEDVSLRLWIYTGTKTTDRGTYKYEINEEVDANGEVTIEISRYARDYLRTLGEGVTSRVYWVETEVAKDTGSGLGAYSTDLAPVIATMGYSLAENGINDDSEYTALTKFITDKPYVLLPTDGSALMSSIRDDGVTPIIEFFDAEDGGGSSLATTSVSGNLDESSQQWTITGSGGAPGALSMVYKVNSVAQETINIKRFTESKYESWILQFINKYGAKDWLWSQGRVFDSFNSTEEQYMQNIMSGGTYDYNDHSRRVVNKQAKRRIVWNSGWYPDTFNEAFLQCFLSEEHWLTDPNGSTDIPVILVDKQFRQKDTIFDKVIQYTFTFEFSHNYINNIQ